MSNDARSRGRTPVSGLGIICGQLLSGSEELMLAGSTAPEWNMLDLSSRTRPSRRNRPQRMTVAVDRNREDVGPKGTLGMLC